MENGSTGERRKRDFVFTQSFYSCPASERTADSSEDRGVRSSAHRISDPCAATGERQRKIVPQNDVGREFGADRRSNIGTPEGPGPGVARIDEERAVHRLDED